LFLILNGECGYSYQLSVISYQLSVVSELIPNRQSPVTFSPITFSPITFSPITNEVIMMLRSRKYIPIAIAIFSVGSTVAIASPLWHSKTLSSPAWEQSIAQMPGRGRGEGRGEVRGRLLEQLNLTDTQKQKLSGIRQKYSERIEQLQDSMQKAQEELFKMMAGTASVSDIRTKQQEVVRLREELGNVRFESMLEMRAVLTPEQRDRIGQMLHQRRDNWRNYSGDRSHKNWFW
jgi:Spy/CpxP family protein refolding chaperone